MDWKYGLKTIALLYIMYAPTCTANNKLVKPFIILILDRIICFFGSDLKERRTLSPLPSSKEEVLISIIHKVK